MQSVFLSYTYNPHPDHQEETLRMAQATRVMIEALNLRVTDGVDLGGRAVDFEILKRIDAADALVALVTPQATAGGGIAIPPYVDDEYKYAKGQKKPAIRVLHESLQPQGIGKQDEYIPFRPGEELDTMLKLLRTLALWKRQIGGPQEIRIEPDDLGGRFDVRANHTCQYQLMIEHEQTDWQSARIWPEPGATYAFLPGVPDKSKIRLKLNLGAETWESQFTNPLGRIALSRR